MFTLFFFNAPSPPAIYPLSLHDALPISVDRTLSGAEAELDQLPLEGVPQRRVLPGDELEGQLVDRKSTRLNSSHRTISYAVFCLKKKKKNKKHKKQYNHTLIHV